MLSRLQSHLMTKVRNLESAEKSADAQVVVVRCQLHGFQFVIMFRKMTKTRNASCENINLFLITAIASIETSYVYR